MTNLDLGVAHRHLFNKTPATLTLVAASFNPAASELKVHMVLLAQVAVLASRAVLADAAIWVMLLLAVLLLLHRALRQIVLRRSVTPPRHVITVCCPGGGVFFWWQVSSGVGEGSGVVVVGPCFRPPSKSSRARATRGRLLRAARHPQRGTARNDRPWACLVACASVSTGSRRCCRPASSDRVYG